MSLHDRMEVQKLMDNICANDSHKKYVAKGIRLVNEKEEIYSVLNEYVQNTHSPLHNQYKIKVVQIFRIDHPRDERYRSDIGNCQLLFHGTERESVYPILRDGFRSKTGSDRGLFGRAIYFTNCSSKAANFTSNDLTKFDGAADQGQICPDNGCFAYIFLSQVAIGNSAEYRNVPKVKNRSLLNGKNSVKGVGKRQPDPSFTRRVTFNEKSKADIPMGPLKLVNQNVYLEQDEYAIYKADQVRNRFLLVVQIIK